MAKSFSVVLLVSLMTDVSWVAAIEHRFTSDPPTLSISDSTLKINASDSLELTCRGRQYLGWVTPHNRTHTDNRLTIRDCSGAGLFCSTLTLTAAIANETGEYRCSYRNLPVEDGKSSVAVYVFVQDYKVPFVHSAQDYDVVFIREGEQVVIPCLGSVEDLNVTLHTKYPLKELVPDGKEVWWDSRRGFYVPSHVISYAGVVFCQTRVGNATFQSSLYIVAVVGYKIYDLTISPTLERLSVGERLVLNCTAHTELNVGMDFQWTFPQRAHPANSSAERSRVEIRPFKKKLWNSLELSSSLILENVTMNHTGEYICTASSGQMVKSSRASLVVYEKPFILLTDQRIHTMVVNPGQKEVKIPVKYYGYPEPSVRWFKNRQPISRKDEYRMRPTRDCLTIFDVTEQDSGNYTVVMINKITKEERSRTFQLLVNVYPKIFEKDVAGDTDVHMYGSSATIRCTSRGGPTPINFEWQWMPEEDCPIVFQHSGSRAKQLLKSCTKWKELSNSTRYNDISSPTTTTDASLKTVSTLRLQKALGHALYKCVAANKVGSDERVVIFRVTRGLGLRVLPSTEPIEEDAVVLSCEADRGQYSGLSWFRVNASRTEAQSLPEVVPCGILRLPALPLPNVTLSERAGTNALLELAIERASWQHEGPYACSVQNRHTHERTCLLTNLRLRALEVPEVQVNSTEQRVNVSDTSRLVCAVRGTPEPTITWTKDNRTVVPGSGVVLTGSNRVLMIQRVKPEDAGVYSCRACNRLGCDATSVQLSVEGAEERMNVELIVPIGSVVIAMFFWLLVVFIIRNRKRPSDSMLKAGYLSMILDSEDLPMDEQCERLLYDDSRWEFPRDRLKLGEPLGRGAFGQVVEAAAFGIEKVATCTTVAVKMLKEGATSSEYRALMSELKILIHIGHHLNVVNLLGACTKPGGPLMVIVEYCKHGNLSSYLKSRRDEYCPFKRQTPSLHRGEVEGGDDLAEGDLGLGSSARLDICTGTALPSTSEQLSLRRLQELEESSDWSPLTLEDLISYSFQVAKGMEFLASRKCIHRDLAARNILLSENNVVKICDFGLARDVYKDPDYVRKGDARLPLKWMAPETIFDRVYTTQSDVWSFGVLLWEIFSLGASPYPGVCIDESFCRRLKEGTRMRAPDYATPEIYQTMLDCWLDRPKDRPTFSELVEQLGDLLQASAQQDGKDYIPVTVGQAEGSSGMRTANCRASQQENITQLQYDNAPVLGYSQMSDRCMYPISAQTFEDIPLEHTAVMEGHMVSGMGLSRVEVKDGAQSDQRTPTFGPLLRCKSKESLASESSNQTSGYQSGYHSDEADAPIYANEEMIRRRDFRKKPPLPRRDDKLSAEVRYSVPPV